MSKRSDGHSGQNGERHQAAAVERDRDLSFTIGEATLIFPEPSDVGSSSSRLGIDQISGPNGSGQVAGLGEVATLIFRGEEGGVSAGSGSSPSGVLLFPNEECQSPAGVDSRDYFKWDFDGSKDIHEPDFTRAHLNSGLVEQDPNQKSSEGCGCNCTSDGPKTAFSDSASDGQSHDQTNNPGDYLAKTRSKDLHNTNDSLATGVFA